MLFPFGYGGEATVGAAEVTEGDGDDGTPANRTALPDLRQPLSVADGGVDELLRREANRLPRASGRHAAVAVPRAYVRPLRLLGCRARLQRGGRLHPLPEGARLERARPADHQGA